ncbi:MAG: ABC transporter ATP-binding protein [Oscillospiraceae bacterium]|nr:ABC transporter ATP-binding protein [Oscillospiraceae bacterium]
MRNAENAAIGTAAAQIPTLSTEDLSVGYGKTTVVNGIRIRVETGEILCLIGPNGAGKSTILKTLIRQLLPMDGAVLLEGTALTDLKERELARKSAAVLTGRISPELMTCEELVAMGRYPYTGMLGILSETDREKVDETIRMVGIEEIRKKDFDCISDGQRQRVMLARALCQEPKLLIMDEPTSFLDIRNKLEFLGILRRLVRERDLAVIMSLHELDLAQKYCDRIVCVGDGKVRAVGTPEEIFSGDMIRELYAVEHGSYDCLFGSVEPERNSALPRAFVIGSGGSGIPVYRRLQREGIPFAAGVLPENDLDLPVAKALASAVITDRANEAVSAERVDDALAVLKTCETVYCTTERFGTVNRENRRLLEYAKEHGLLKCEKLMNGKD